MYLHRGRKGQSFEGRPFPFGVLSMVTVKVTKLLHGNVTKMSIYYSCFYAATQRYRHNRHAFGHTLLALRPFDKIARLELRVFVSDCLSRASHVVQKSGSQ